uniref:Uncharacterized protein n=1 Tax=Ascaris lumbricoides TaxID=6252 RepID=A0A0M3INB8_ASCLU
MPPCLVLYASVLSIEQLKVVFQESVKNVFNEAIFIYFEGLNSRQREFSLI